MQHADEGGCRGSLWRARWAAIGAAVAVAFGGAGGYLIANADTSTASALVPIAPCRLADTRPVGVGVRQTPVGAGETVTFTVWGTNGDCSIPTTATGISANVTVVDPTAASFLTVFPADVGRPNASNLNYTAGQAPVPNSVTVKLSSDGKLNVFNNQGRVDVIIDIVGFYVPSTSGPAGATGPTGAAGPGSASCIELIRWDKCNKPTATITGLNGPAGVAFDGTNIWVTNQGSGTVSKINPSTNTVTATVTVGSFGSGPSGVAFDGTNIWVTNRGSGTVSKINPTTNTVTATVAGLSGPYGVAYDGTNIWVTGVNTVSKIPV